MMNEKKAIEKINSIAVELSKENSTFTRAELAYELSDCGIQGDSALVSQLVWDAYQKGINKSAIARAFTDNAGVRRLTEAYQIQATLDDGNMERAICLTHGQSDMANSAVRMLERQIEQSLADIVVKGGTGLVSHVTGTAGVEKVKNEADVLFDRYTRLVDSYGEARSRVQDVTSAFVDLRTEIESVYRQYAMALVDVFGDSVKVVSPNLFDFGSIEWLDVQEMLKQTGLKYTTVSARCTQLISEISDSFSNTLRSSLAGSRSVNNKQLGLIAVAVGMVGHYMSASADTSALKMELETLKSDMKRDATNIKGDMMRLAKIFKKVNELYIPQADIFYRYAADVLDGELKALLDSIYSNPEARKLKEERDKLLKEYKETERCIGDAQGNIAYYTGHIVECNQLLDSLRPQYESARGSKPSRPFFLVNWLTFGKAGSTYNRNMYNWMQACGPVVERYEGLQVDVKLDCEDKEAQEKLLAEYTSQYKGLKPRLDRLSREMMAAVKVDNATKRKMAAHLEDMVKLLRIAKSIMESKLDARDLRAVTIAESTTIALPDEVKRNLDNFTDTLKGLTADAAGYMDSNLTAMRRPALTENDMQNMSEQEIEIYRNQQAQMDMAVADASYMVNVSAEAVARTADAFNQWLQLEAIRGRNRQTARNYDRQLEELKVRFKREMDGISDKAALLRGVMAQINTATTPEQRKRGLMLLADIDSKTMSEAEWDAFLSGDKTITI